jgi:hypothetical protein
MAANRNSCTSFTSSGTTVTLTAEEIAEHGKALDDLSTLERQFADVELEQRVLASLSKCARVC